MILNAAGDIIRCQLIACDLSSMGDRACLEPV